MARRQHRERRKCVLPTRSHWPGLPTPLALNHRDGVRADVTPMSLTSEVATVSPRSSVDADAAREQVPAGTYAGQAGFISQGTGCRIAVSSIPRSGYGLMAVGVVSREWGLLMGIVVGGVELYAGRRRKHPPVAGGGRVHHRLPSGRGHPGRHPRRLRAGKHSGRWLILGVSA